MLVVPCLYFKRRDLLNTDYFDQVNIRTNHKLYLLFSQLFSNVYHSSHMLLCVDQRAQCSV